MLEITTKYGCFGHFKDLYLFMLEENLFDIEILEVRYCLGEIYVKGIYSLEQIRTIVY